MIAKNPGQTKLAALNPKMLGLGGAAVGGLTGAAADDENRLRGALVGGLVGGGAGYGTGKLLKAAPPKPNKPKLLAAPKPQTPSPAKSEFPEWDAWMEVMDKDPDLFKMTLEQPNNAEALAKAQKLMSKTAAFGVVLQSHPLWE